MWQNQNENAAGVDMCNIWPGYEDDVYLLVKLGEAALVVFIIFAVVAILYMIVSCCLAAARNQK